MSSIPRDQWYVAAYTAEIGRELELTAAAVRRHLDALEEDSLVEVKRVTAARGAGRPSRRYVVTSHAQEHLPKDHLAVALDTLARLEELGGEEEVRRTARHAFREIGRRHGDYAIVACAAVVRDGQARLAVGGVADRPVVRALPAPGASDLDDALDALVAGVQEQFPGMRFALVGEVDAHHDLRTGCGHSRDPSSSRDAGGTGVASRAAAACANEVNADARCVVTSGLT